MGKEFGINFKIIWHDPSVRMEKTKQSDWLERCRRWLGCIKLPTLSNLIWFLLSRISKPTWIKLVELQMNLSTFIMRQWIKDEGYVDILTTVRTVLYIFCLFFFSNLHYPWKEWMLVTMCGIGQIETSVPLAKDSLCYCAALYYRQRIWSI